MRTRTHTHTHTVPVSAASGYAASPSHPIPLADSASYTTAAAYYPQPAIKPAAWTGPTETAIFAAPPYHDPYLAMAPQAYPAHPHSLPPPPQHHGF